jgi:hypothetical protein
VDLSQALDAVLTALSTGRDVGRSVTEWWKVVLALAAVGLALGWRWMPRRLAIGALLALVVWSGANYFRYGPKTAFASVDTYDVLHYYLNAKFFDELGYYDLYPAMILADHDNGGPYYDEGSKYMAQDADGHRLMPIEHALDRGWEVRQRFTPERWRSFTHDFLYLHREVPGMSDKLWRQLIQDHGFNGTVVWLLEATPFTRVPVEWVKVLGWADVGLLAMGLGAVAAAYGNPTALWAALFLFLTYSTRWPTITWALLRYDYVTALLVGMAAVRAGRPFVGGVATAWAGTLRLFPAMWIFGAGAQAGLAALRGELHRPALRLLGGFALGALVLQGAATAVFGTATVAEHFVNMEDHNEAANLSSRRIGLALALPFTQDVTPDAAPKNITKETKATVEEQKPLRFALAGLVMAGLAWGLRRKEGDEAYAFGFLPFFLLTTASYYYYVARITLIVLHASRLDRPRHIFGLAWLMGLEAFSNWAETRFPEERVFLVGWLAWGLFAYAVGMVLWMGIESRRDAITAPGSPSR